MQMLTGIVMIGIGLVAFVLIWGNRTRRRARELLPPMQRGDELWFLKPKKKHPRDGGPE